MLTGLTIARRVSELCEAVQAVSGEDASSQVLLASDGRQMNPSETIGAYSITVGCHWGLCMNVSQF